METFKHEYEYSEKFGVLLFIVLIDQKGKQSRIPITMLSLFEGHAFSNEELRKINDIKIITNKDVKNKFINLIESEYYSCLNDPNNHEYNILLPETDELFEKWFRAKKYFIEAFGGSTILEIPYKISFKLDDQEKNNKIEEFIDIVANNYGNEKLADFIADA